MHRQSPEWRRYHGLSSQHRRKGRAAASVMRAEGIAPPVIMRGADFHVEASAGTSVMKDFFHFDEDLAPPAALAGLLAKLHALPVDWYDALKDTFLKRDPRLQRC